MPAATAAARKTPGASGAGRGLTDVQRKLHSLGLVTADDCILHLPLRYEDETRIVPSASLRSEERRVGKGWVRTCRSGGSTYHTKKKVSSDRESVDMGHRVNVSA